MCTFCGNGVCLSVDRSLEEMDASQQPASNSERKADEEAVAFKNRLVDYDRNAAKCVRYVLLTLHPPCIILYNFHLLFHSGVQMLSMTSQTTLR